MGLTTPLTQQQWYDKLKAWIPDWYLTQKSNQEAHLQALAFIMSIADRDNYNHARATFIEYGEGADLNEHGFERSNPRLPGELDEQYRVRLRSFTNESDCPSLKRLVDAVLMAGVATIIEDYNSAVFTNRSYFFNRGSLLIDDIINVFTVLVDKQVHDPYSFANRRYFCNRQDFMSTRESSAYVFQQIQAIIDNDKAVGTMYRIIERLGA